VRDERPELHEEPNTPEPPWNAYAVVGVAAAPESAEAREEAGEERSQQVRAPQPVGAGGAAEREEGGQQADGRRLARTIRAREDDGNPYGHPLERVRERERRPVSSPKDLSERCTRSDTEVIPLEVTLNHSLVTRRPYSLTGAQVPSPSAEALPRARPYAPLSASIPASSNDIQLQPFKSTLTFSGIRYHWSRFKICIRPWLEIIFAIISLLTLLNLINV